MVNSSPFPVISVEGDPYELGYQYGSQTKLLIEGALHNYRSSCKRNTKLEWDQVLELSKKFVPFIEGYDPEALEEMRGVAEGSGKTLEDILVLNVRTELTFLASSGGIGPGECTTLVAAPEVTISNHTLIGQNWDWTPEAQKVSIILKKMRKGKPNCVTFLEAGILGKTGFNSAGMAFVGNVLITDKMCLGVPVLIMCNKMLSAENLVDAIGMVLSPQRASSTNRMIAAADGECIDIETSPDDYNVMFPDDGIIVHTNHFTVPIPNIKDVGPSLWPHTLTRRYRAHQLLAAERGNITVEVMKNIFRDHLGKPYSICRHVDERHPEETQHQTNASLIMDLNEKTLYIAKGPPCENEYVTLAFGDIL